MADVFISYKQRMRPRVLEIARALESLGLSVWFDAELEAGKSFGAVINAELAKARCVLVCWTPDAFAPEDGSEVSWVEAEATVARERKVIVPVMLERVALRAPWNMFHTERLMEWTRDAPTDPRWQGVLDAIGRNVGRPGLAEYAAAMGSPARLVEWARKYPADPLAGAALTAQPASRAETARHWLRRTLRVSVQVRWLLGATLVTTLGAIFLMLRFGPDASGSAAYPMYVGPIISALIFAIALWRAGLLDLGRALFTVAAVLVGYVAAIFTAPLVDPVLAIFGFSGELAVGFVNGLLAGFAGAFFALGGIALLVGGFRRSDWLRLTAGSVGIGLVCGVLGLGPLKPLYHSNFFWIAVAWTLLYGLLMTWLVAGRSARTL